MKRKMLLKSVWMIVRKSFDDGHEWIDTATISSSRTDSLTIAQKNEQDIPQWATRNPVIAVSKGYISETETFMLGTNHG